MKELSYYQIAYPIFLPCRPSCNPCLLNLPIYLIYSDSNYSHGPILALEDVNISFFLSQDIINVDMNISKGMGVLIILVLFFGVKILCFMDLSHAALCCSVEVDASCSTINIYTARFI